MKPILKFVQMNAQRVSSSIQIIDLDYSLTSHYQIIDALCESSTTQIKDLSSGTLVCSIKKGIVIPVFFFEKRILSPIPPCILQQFSLIYLYLVCLIVHK